ncbi:related to mfs-multidrug-resistance transporter [Fusarium fujikuroi]|nr:related to mfs-multidrug-resistance transporter [Fusarium fujikuroi]SCO08767.1 related to mfs-multidrug-resistance transporter [Fusarium fujikuroi]SCO22755.1 related to mfs-multidrug-resistance transporter [Fusarium fujikuroi]SCO37126.1 related to mfs-multidrug-resistance transporter [Fusarium fujikuroi]SCO39960.1 related to mfs-multidrug-resistance transporter [Fusarium fujikuroi]
MNSLQRGLSKIALSPSPDSERLETNRDDIVEFRDDDVDNPRNWSLARKRYVTAITMLLLANGSIASSTTAGNTQSITQEFGISNVAAQLTTSLYLLGFCTGPFLFGPLSEFYDRQWLLYLTFFLYFCFTFLTAWPPDLGSLLMGGFPAGYFAAGPFAIVPGVLVDLWDKCESGNAMGIMICLYKTALTRPWVLLFDTISLLCCLYSCIITALQYMLFSIYPIVFQDLRGWNPAVSQLPVLGQAVSAVFGLLMVLYHTRRRKAKVNMGREVVPEDHMVLAMIGGVGLPISMLWLCWSAQYRSVYCYILTIRHSRGFVSSSAHWIVPTAGGTVLATCLMLIHVSCFSYVADTYADYAASIIASNIVARCIGSAGAPIFTSQTFEALGMGGGGSLIAGVAALLAVIPFLFYRYRHTIQLEVSTLLLEQDSQGQAR